MPTPQIYSNQPLEDYATESLCHCGKFRVSSESVFEVMRREIEGATAPVVRGAVPVSGESMDAAFDLRVIPNPVFVETFKQDAAVESRDCGRKVSRDCNAKVLDEFRAAGILGMCGL